MEKTKILLVEDNPDDAQLVRCMLEDTGWNLHFEKVDSYQKLVEKLAQPWDIVISDYSLPSLTGLDSLRLVKEKDPDIPFIIISGTIGEDIAVEVMRAGAQDYLMKDNLTRLVPAIKREIEEGKIRREKRKVQKALQEKEREQAVLIDILQQKTEDLEELLFISSHDLKSPLVNIGGFSQELADSCKQIQYLIHESAHDSDLKRKFDHIVDNDIHQDVSIISDNIDKMHRFLENLGTLCRLEKEPLKLEQLDMNQLVNEVVHLKNNRLKEKNREISIEIQPLSDCYSNRDKVIVVIDHLLDNAIRYMDPARKGVIQIDSSQKEDAITYCISDNGIGIHQDHMPKIFAIFHQLNPDPQDTSTGIGLTIVKRLLHRLQGSIRCESNIGTGSRFYFELPAQEKAYLKIE